MGIGTLVSMLIFPNIFSHWILH